jgi:hypothetical protein
LTFNKFPFSPKFLCVVEIDPMLFLVLFAFIGIKLEVHLVLESRIFSAKIKPFLLKRQRAGNHLWCLRRTIVGPFSGFLGSSRFIAGVCLPPGEPAVPLQAARSGRKKSCSTECNSFKINVGSGRGSGSLSRLSMQSRFYRRSAPGARPRARGDKQRYRLRLP